MSSLTSDDNNDNAEASDKLVPDPHDALFKAAFSSPHNAAGELQAILPPSIVRHIDFSTLKAEPANFVDVKLAKTFTDLLFSAKFGELTGYIYVLHEHQSTNDRWLLVRVLGYIVSIWKHLLRAGHSGPLPVVLPVVLHHSDSGWTSPTELAQLFDPNVLQIPGLDRFLPNYSIVLDDISRLSNAELRSRHTLELFPLLVLWSLRDGRSYPRWLDGLRGHWCPDFEALLSEENPEAWQQIFKYISCVAGKAAPAVARDLAQVFPALKDAAMTIAQQFEQVIRAQGIAEGRLEGRLEERVDVVLEQARLKFGPLSDNDIKRIETATPDDLKRFTANILSASSIDELFH